MLTNGVDFAPNESIVSEVKNIECKPKKESDMALYNGLKNQDNFSA